jgi:hypothetical protein
MRRSTLHGQEQQAECQGMMIFTELAAIPADSLGDGHSHSTCSNHERSGASHAHEPDPAFHVLDLDRGRA